MKRRFKILKTVLSATVILIYIAMIVVLMAQALVPGEESAEISDNFGAFVAVDNLYSGLIPKKEFFGEVKVGDRITARVVSVKEDGKLDLSIREKALTQILIDAKKVLDVIESFDGVLPFNDKASPEVIKREMQMSKNEFKKAVGHLLKSGKIEITEKSIRLK